MHPGKVLFWKTGLSFFPAYVVHFPTKLHWKDPSQMVWISKGLLSLRDQMLILKARSAVMPALGCGFGGLAWTEMLQEVKEVFGAEPNIEVHLFEPR